MNRQKRKHLNTGNNGQKKEMEKPVTPNSIVDKNDMNIITGTSTNSPNKSSDEKIARWTKHLGIATYGLALFTIILCLYARKEFEESKQRENTETERHNISESKEADKSNAELVQSISNEIYQRKESVEIIMLAENDLLVFDTVHEDLRLPKGFPIFRINLDSSSTNIRVFLSEASSKKMYYSSYEVDNVLAPLDRAGGFFRNNLMKIEDLHVFFYWPSVMLAKNQAIREYFRWLQHVYTKENSGGFQPYGLHYYDLRRLVDTVYKYQLDKNKKYFNIHDDTTKVLDW